MAHRDMQFSMSGRAESRPVLRHRQAARTGTPDVRSAGVTALAQRAAAAHRSGDDFRGIAAWALEGVMVRGGVSGLGFLWITPKTP